MAKHPSDRLLEKHSALVQSNDCKVRSHVQREAGEWLVNTLMLEGYDVPFRYKRKKKYKNLAGARVNLSYYAETEVVAGIEVEVMKVVRLRRS